MKRVSLFALLLAVAAFSTYALAFVGPTVSSSQAESVCDCVACASTDCTCDVCECADCDCGQSELTTAVKSPVESCCATSDVAKVKTSVVSCGCEVCECPDCDGEVCSCEACPCDVCECVGCACAA